MAKCGPAIFDENTLRPIFGLMNWNLYYSKIDSLTNSIFESNIETAIHEITHGLGFIDDYFSKFYDSVTGAKYSTDNSFKSADGIIFLSTPRILNFAKFHFNCSTLKGV